MEKGYLNEKFYSSDPDSSKSYEKEKFISIFKSFDMWIRLKSYFLRDHYLSSEDFSFITWNNFCEFSFKEHLKRSDEDILNVKFRKEYLESQIEEFMHRKITLFRVWHNGRLYLYDISKFYTEDNFINSLY